MLLFAYFLLIALALTVWSALTLGNRARRDPWLTSEDEPSDPIKPAQRHSNDELRGARATVRPSGHNEDAFERFLHADRKD